MTELSWETMSRLLAGRTEQELQQKPKWWKKCDFNGCRIPDGKAK